MKLDNIICWWSGGVTSAVACKLAIDLFGPNNCKVIFIDTFNEAPDTYRFKKDCEKWYNMPIETITGIGDKYKTINDVWYKNLSLNTANGAICSTALKRQVREKWQRKNFYKHQVFGFDIKEPKRAYALKKNHPGAKSIFPLLMYGYDKETCIKIIQLELIRIPEAYYLGYLNNNCFKTGCVQGGIGYWQKIQKEYPAKFDQMALIEHELTDLKGQPVTMLKEKKGKLIFLKPHKNYPEYKDISKLKGRPPKPLIDCNGFCGVNDLSPRNDTEKELNY